MAGLLSIVATPIGNLADLSPRASKTLKAANLIFAASANHSKILLNSIGVDFKKTKLIDSPAIKETSRIKLLLEKLEQDSHIAIISDAGAPCVSDPGGKLIHSAIQAGHKIEIIPGPSAVIATLMGAGLISNRFAFLGFLPKKGKERTQLILESIKAGLALIIFESPRRIKKTLENLAELCGPQNIVIARELTKNFETFHRGILGEKLTPELVEKGEMVIIIEAIKEKLPSPDLNQSRSSSSQIERGLMGHKALAKKIALEEGISIKSAYQALLTKDAK